MIETRLLYYFLAVAREQSITSAANVLHITQPTLSRQMAMLEEEVGAKLFVKSSRPLALTNEGMLLKRRAEEILELMKKTEDEISLREEQIEGTVSIGCGELASVKMLSDILAGFSEKYPRIIFDVFTANADEVKHRMDNGLTDMGLLLEPVDMEKYEYIRMPMKERWTALVPSGVPMAKQEHVTSGDLANIPIIMPRRQKVRDEVASWFGDYYKDLKISAICNFSTNAAMLVRAGLGYALTVEGGLPFLDKSEITMVPLYPELSATSVIAWKREQPVSAAVSRFMEYTKCFLSMHSS